MHEISEIADNHDIGITTHWAEDENNVEYAKKEFDMTMSELADRMKLLKPNVTLAHGIYFGEEEINDLARSEVSICHCPVCNSKLAMGVAKVPQMLKSGVNVCLGTDGAPVNNTLDMFREMRHTVLLHRINSMTPLFPRTEEAIEMATSNGAKALRMSDEIGSIEPGKKADLIIVDIENPRTIPVHDPVSPLVWTATGQDVSTTIIDGQIIMEDRDVKTIDESKVMKDVKRIKEKIRKQAGIEIDEKWPHI
jgi:cytosine/adenosine deaminase-related metal-dependent hydrolase